MSGNIKELKQLRKTAERQGWLVTITNGGHWKWAKGDKFFFSAATPSDHRAIKNIRARLRQANKGMRIH